MVVNSVFFAVEHFMKHISAVRFLVLFLSTRMTTRVDREKTLSTITSEGLRILFRAFKNFTTVQENTERHVVLRSNV